VDTSPAPYVPGETPDQDQLHLKPWQRRKPGESARDYHARLNRTCYSCGAYIVDPLALDAHEASHAAR
jgi:hypothetical protein